MRLVHNMAGQRTFPLEILGARKQTQQKTENNMRVLSYNIHKGIGGRDRRYRLERVLSVNRKSHMHAPSFCEISRSTR
jgi:hypothetical protein